MMAPRVSSPLSARGAGDLYDLGILLQVPMMAREVSNLDLPPDRGILDIVS